MIIEDHLRILQLLERRPTIADTGWVGETFVTDHWLMRGARILTDIQCDEVGALKSVRRRRK